MRQGDFSELLNASNFYYGKVVTIKDPTSGTPFPGNIIPKAQTSPNGLGILKAWPTPNLAIPINGNQLWYVGVKHPQNQRKDTLSADFNLTDKQRLQFRRMNYAFWEYQPLDGGTDETPKYFNRPNQTNSLNEVWTLAPNKVNEFLATVSLDDVYIPVNQQAFLDRTKVGINYPYIFPAGKLISTRIPSVNMTSFSGLSGGPYPSHSGGPIYEISDSFTWVKGRHTFKFGGLYEKSGENDNDEINVSACPTCTNNQNGQFAFTDTRSGQPSTGNAAANAAMGLFDSYSELGQRAYTIFRGSMWEFFAKDAWKVGQKMTIDYGVRYTVIVPYRALWGNMIVFDPSLYDPSKAVKIDPKTGFVIPGSGDKYDGMVIPGTGWPSSAAGRFPEASDTSLSYLFRGVKNNFSDVQWGDYQPRVGIAYQASGKTVIRTGIGRFFTRLGVSDSVFLGGNPPFQPTANVSFGSADNPGGTSANSLPLTVTTQSKAFKNPEAWAWNFTVERQLPWNTVTTVAYVARRGLHMQREANINQPTPDVIAANPGVNIDALRPYKGYNSIRETDNVASSMYNSLQLTWNRRFTRGFGFGISYTLSKAMDDGSAQRDIIPDTYYAHNLWSQADFDVRHIFIANYIYELPFFRNQNNLAGRFLGGWQFSGIVQFQTGTPSSVAVGTDYVGVGMDGSISNAGQFWSYSQIPDVTHQIALNGTSDPYFWFATKDSSGNAIFTQPTKGTFVHQNNIRNIIHNPGLENWNVGLFKKIAVTEKVAFQFRAEAFDVLNHPNWSGAGFNPTSASFGKITGKTGDVRNMQLSLRLSF
jgi:predicted heme/steroid binding protein